MSLAMLSQSNNTSEPTTLRPRTLRPRRNIPRVDYTGMDSIEPLSEYDAITDIWYDSSIHFDPDYVIEDTGVSETTCVPNATSVPTYSRPRRNIPKVDYTGMDSIEPEGKFDGVTNIWYDASIDYDPDYVFEEEDIEYDFDDEDQDEEDEDQDDNDEDDKNEDQDNEEEKDQEYDFEDHEYKKYEDDHELEDLYLVPEDINSYLFQKKTKKYVPPGTWHVISITDNWVQNMKYDPKFHKNEYQSITEQIIVQTKNIQYEVYFMFDFIIRNKKIISMPIFESNILKIIKSDHTITTRKEIQTICHLIYKQYQPEIDNINNS